MIFLPILREINLEDYRSAKSAILTQLEPLNFDYNEFFSFLRLKSTKWTKSTALEMAKLAIFALLPSSKLISCKIWTMEKSSNFPQMCTMSNFICQWLYLLFWLDYYYLFGASLQFAAVVHHSATASISYFCRPRLPTSPKTKLRPPWMMKKLPILWFPHLNSVLLFTDSGQVIPMYHHYPIGLFLGRI